MYGVVNDILILHLSAVEIVNTVVNCVCCRCQKLCQKKSIWLIQCC